MPHRPPDTPPRSSSGEPPTPPPRAVDFAAVRDWPGYYRVMLGKPARETLVEALDRFEREGAAPANGGRRAVDLGCGEGRDTLELLRRGWRVLAIDEHPEAARLLAGRVPADRRPLLEVRTAPFHAMDWLGVDLVNASFSLPFCAPGQFPSLWSAIVGSIRPGGRFAGQFFGDRDSWASLPDRTHHAEAEVGTLLAAFDVETLRIDERDDADARGAPKHWHVFHVVARKR